MGKKTPPFPNYPSWTTARFFTFLRSALRAAWNKYPPKYEALKASQVGRKINVKTGKLAMHHECAECHKHFPTKEVHVDHLVDAGTLTKFSDIQSFVERLFCSVNDLQVLCHKCHKGKTSAPKAKNATTKKNPKKQPPKKGSIQGSFFDND